MSETFTTDSTFVAAQITLDTLMQALRAGQHVMMTPPQLGRPEYEVSIFRDGEPCYGVHATDPLCALLIALAKYSAAPPPSTETT
jgi:hypothetical protein